MSTASMTAERFVQRAFEVGLLDSRQVDSVWSELGTRDVSLEAVVAVMLRKELLTNFQVDRILRGERTGYFYGKYKVLYLIGAGTFARVYRAVHTETGRVVAVKVLRKRHRDNPVEFEQFLREGRMGSELRHVNVVPIYEVNADPRAPFMVMEFVEGQTLRQMMAVRKKLDPQTALTIIADVLAGLAYAVEKGITHRDLKLSNVLVSSSGRAKLVDFGLAAAQTGNDDELADCPNARAIDYAALERGTNVRKDDVRSDIYFAGCILYNLLSGRAPLVESKDRLQRLNVSRFREIPPLNSIEPGLPAAVLSIVNRSMELDPTKRYQSAAEMLRDVQAVLHRMKIGAPLPALGAPTAGESAANGGTTTEPAGGTEVVEDVLEGESRTLMIVESNTAMQNVFRDRLKKRGYRVLIISDPDRAIERLQDQLDDPSQQAPDCLVFSASELAEEAVEAFNRCGSEKLAAVPAILLLDAKQRELARAAKIGENRMVLIGPKLSDLRMALSRLIQLGST